MNNESIMQQNNGLIAFLVADREGDGVRETADENQVACFPSEYFVPVKLIAEESCLSEVTNERILVMNPEGKIGMIAAKGNTVIPLQYDSLSDVIVNDIVFFRKGLVCGFMKTDETILAEYSNCVLVQQKEGFIHHIEYEGGTKKAEIDLSTIC